MAHQKLKLSLMASILSALYGCANTTEILSTKVLHSGIHCGINKEGLKKLDQKAALNKIVNHGLRPPSNETPDADFNLQHIIAISMGIRPSTGYSLSLQNNKVTQEGRTVYIDIEHKEPREGSMNAQLMTSPCLVFAIAKGHYSEIVASPYKLELNQ